MKLTGEKRRKFLSWKYSRPGMKEVRQGSPEQIEAVLNRLESNRDLESAEDDIQEVRIDRSGLGPLSEYECSWCGRKYRSDMELMSCPECHEAGKPDSGDYDFGADEDDL